MCGILGVVSSSLPDNKIIKDALDSIKHRGLDDEGDVFLNVTGSDYISASASDTCLELRGIL